MATPLTPIKLVTIITEHILREQLLRKLLELGAKGFSYHAVMGQGSGGVRKDVISGDNIRVECLCDQATADKILEYVTKHYINHYACVAWIADVSVVTEAQFVPKA